MLNYINQTYSKLNENPYRPGQACIKGKPFNGVIYNLSFRKFNVHLVSNNFNANKV